MGTRSLVGQAESDGSIRGVYVHWDGYPGARIPRLFENAEYYGGPRQLLETILSHPEGWSAITEPPLRSSPDYSKDHSQCYCDHTCSGCGGDGEVASLGNLSSHCELCDGSGVMTFDPDKTNTMVCLGENCDGAACDPLFMEWVYGIHDGGIDVYGAFEKEPGNPQGGYIHRLVGFADWNESPNVGDMLEMRGMQMRGDLDEEGEDH